MSNIYIQEPPTEGKVLLVTSAGDFDIELWSKEAPKACRNFVQLCMEGYYQDAIFHRVVPGFIVQGGDPTGTGTGGESIYGSPFKDEFHTRLRFVRRGLVAMANAGPNDNGSQFFFTLEATPELQNKHTIFGKVAGDTVYNLSRFTEGEIDKDGKPEFPHKIIKTEILNNPFDDIVPRVAIENEIQKEDLKKKKGTKNFKLLSFGDEAEEDEEQFVTATKKMGNKGNSAHDIAKDPTLSASVGESKAKRDEELKKIREKLKKTNKSQEELESQEVNATEEALNKEKLQKDKTRSEIKAEIRKLKRELQGKESGESGLEPVSDEEKESKKFKGSEILTQYYKDKEKYVEEKKKLPKKGVSRESQTLALLARFSKKVKDATAKAEEDGSENIKPLDLADQVKSVDNEEDDESWLSHRLLFDDQDYVLAKDASTKDDLWYDLTDPRNAYNKRRREEITGNKIK